MNGTTKMAWALASTVMLHTACGNELDQGTVACNNTCIYAFDNECDDGGGGSLWDICELGSDCNDCGVREELQSLPQDEGAVGIGGRGAVGFGGGQSAPGRDPVSPPASGAGGALPSQACRAVLFVTVECEDGSTHEFAEEDCVEASTLDECFAILAPTRDCSNQCCAEGTYSEHRLEPGSC